MSARRSEDVEPVRIGKPADTQTDRVLAFVAFASRPIPLSVLLDEAPARIAEIIGADIASIYLLEGHGDGLVMRGNVGFSPGARGRIRLRVGEGLTGMAVEFMRPISVVRAPLHDRFRAFDELDEDRFPVFLAVPILGAAGALGAFVLQRRGETPFSPSDIALAVALTAPISSAVRNAQVLDELREKTHRRTGGGTRKVTLPGIPVVPGRALGALAALRRPASGRRPASSRRRDLVELKAAFETADKALASLVATAARLGIGAEAAFLQNYQLMASDQRLRERTLERVKSGDSIAKALDTVARDATRTAIEIVGDPFMEERARDIEDFCNAVLMLASPDLRAELPSKAVLVGDQITVFDLIISARSKPVGVALTELATSPRTRVLLRLLGVPAIVDCAGTFRWASPGDVVLLDADHGFLVINPSKADIATVRAERRG